MNIEKLSRRSFLKRTTVLTVGIASVTLLSGLVNAEEFYYVDNGNIACVTVERDTAEGPYLNRSPLDVSNKCFSVVTCTDLNGNGYFASFAVTPCPLYEEDPVRWAECSFYPERSKIPPHCGQEIFIV